MTPEEAKARALAQAQAEAEASGLFSEDPGFGSAFTLQKVGSSLVKAPFQIAGGAANLVEGAGNKLGDFAAGTPIDEFIPNTKTVLQAGAGLFPGGRTAGELAFNSGAGINKPSSQYGNELRDELAMGIVGGAVPFLGKGAVGVQKSILPTGRQAAEAMASNPLSFPRTLVGKGTTDVQGELVNKVAGSNDALIRNNPTAGIDVNSTNPMQQVGAKIEATGNAATILKQDIRTQVATAEAQGAAARINRIDVDLNASKDAAGTPFYQMIARKDPLVAQLVEDKLNEYFTTPGVPTAVQQNMGVTPPPIPKALTLSEAEDAYYQIGKNIDDLKGWDLSNAATAKMNPSVRDGLVSGLKIAQDQLQKSIQTHIGNIDKTLAPKWARANQDIAYKMNYGEAVDSFQTANSEGFKVGQTENSLNKNVGKSSWEWANPANWRTSASKSATTQLSAVSREAQAVQQLQNLISAKQAMNAAQNTLPRDWSLIKTNGTNLAKFGQLASSMGLISDPSELSKFPDEANKQLLSTMVSNLADAFDPATSAYGSEANGMLNSPVDQDLHKQAALNLPPDKRAAVIGALYDNSRFVPINPQPVPAPAPVPAFGPSVDPMERLKSLQIGSAEQSSPMQQDSSYNGEVNSMLQDMNEAIKWHSV